MTTALGRLSVLWGWYCLALSSALALELHVAPDGNDAWSGKLSMPNVGRTDGPLASLVGARDALRKERARQPAAEPVRIIVADGRYETTEPLVLLPEDGGTAQAPVSYEAAQNARPVFSGGRAIVGFKPFKDGIWRTSVADVADGRWYFEQLFVNGRRAQRARMPNQFWFRPLAVAEEAMVAPEGPDPNRTRQTIRVRPDAFRAVAEVAPEARRDVNVVVYHNWDTTRRFVDRIDPEDNVLETVGESMKPWNPWRRESLFVLENFLGALDEPGEWFLARDGSVYYAPRADEDMTTAEVIAPLAERFLILQGAPAAEKWVEHVIFRGLTFHHGQWKTPPQGFEPVQAAASVEAVVMVDGARHVLFEDCEIAHVGTYALWFRTGCRDNTVRRCHLFDLGAGGVKIGAMSEPKGEVEATSHIVVDNNIIRHGGYIFPSAVGVWIGFSPDNQITHNEIADLYYTGVSVGWRWGYAESPSKRNQIRDNHIHHLGRGPLSDLGGVYTLGPSEGTVVSGNVVHDIHAYSYGGWGLYADEGSTGIVFENNAVYSTKDGGFHHHYGRENVVRNNVLLDGERHQIQASVAEPHLSLTFEHNIICWETGPALAGAWDKLSFVAKGNCWWNRAGEKVEFSGLPLPAWQALGHEQGSVVADPLFVDAARHDFRLRPDSPAIALGFAPFDSSGAGVYGEPTWLSKANAVVYPSLTSPPDELPDPIDENFEHYAVGSTPRSMEVRVENRGDSVVVTEGTAASGHRSLRITDAPGLQHLYNPHVYWSVNCTRGVVSNGFDLRIATNSLINVEWRDWSGSQYHTGTLITIRNGQLTAAGLSLQLPLEQWIRFDIVGDVGAKNSGKWSLVVRVPGQEAREFRELPYGTPEFKALTWIGFSSHVNVASSFDLDNFTLRTN